MVWDYRIRESLLGWAVYTAAVSTPMASREAVTS